MQGGCSPESDEMLNSSFLHQMKFSAEKPRLRKASKRFPCYIQTSSENSLSFTRCYLNLQAVQFVSSSSGAHKQ